MPVPPQLRAAPPEEEPISLAVVLPPDEAVSEISDLFLHETVTVEPVDIALPDGLRAVSVTALRAAIASLDEDATLIFRTAPEELHGASVSLFDGAIVVDRAQGVFRIDGAPVVEKDQILALGELFAQYRGRLLNSEVIADYIWGEPVGRNYIDVAIGRLRKRLGDYGVHLQTVRGKGYRLDDPSYKPKEVVIISGAPQQDSTREKPVTEIIEYGDLAINLARAEVTLGGETVDFSRKEYELLVFFARNPGVMHSRETITLEVWGEEFILSGNKMRTIDVHVTRLRRKLGGCTGLEICAARGHGYRFDYELSTATEQ